jgi:hypothetical protein
MLVPEPEQYIDKCIRLEKENGRLQGLNAVLVEHNVFLRTRNAALEKVRECVAALEDMFDCTCGFTSGSCRWCALKAVLSACPPKEDPNV